MVGMQEQVVMEATSDLLEVPLEIYLMHLMAVVLADRDLVVQPSEYHTIREQVEDLMQLNLMIMITE